MNLHISVLEDTIENRSKVIRFLTEINEEYPVAITEKIDIEEYTNRIFSLGMVLEARVNETTCGMLTFYANNFEEKEGAFSNLAVLKDYRRLGIATALFERSFEIMKEKGMKTVYSFTHKDNSQAIRFHEKMGFVIDPDRRYVLDYNISMIREL